jgi:uncharacterized membrane protein
VVRRWPRVLVAAVVLCGTLAAGWAGDVRPAAAELVTSYPALSLRPGDTATFELRAISGERERMELAIAQMPDGWSARIKGGGREVGAVIADPELDAAPTLDVEVDVPVDARPGRYDVVVTGAGPSGTTTLPLVLTVTELAAAPFEISAEFPELSGEPDQTFTFDVDVANNTGRDVTFAVEALGPPGWQVSARPSGQTQATTLTVKGGEQGTLSVQATPAPDAQEGRYPINVRVIADGSPVEGTFTAIVKGQAELAFIPADERLSLSGEAGSTSRFSLNVANQGSAPLQDVKLSASAPQDWAVEFEPATLDAVAPGQSVPVTARIRPQGDAVSGDYSLTMTAAAEGASENVDVRFQVETSTWWGLIAIAIIVVALVGLGLVFRRFGRR